MPSINTAPIFNGTGGEGSVHEVVGNQQLLCKKYKPGKMNDVLAAKLRYMIANPIKVNDSNSRFAWPLSTLNNKGSTAGFFMQRLSFDRKIYDVYDYIRGYSGSSTDIKSIKSRVTVARNLCVMLNFAEKNNIIIGDFNDKNIGVDSATGFVSMFDCDSFHLQQGQYRCGVCMPGYAAPELINKMRNGTTTDYSKAELPTFTRETDRFALAIHIFRLLMNGVHPFNGIDVSLTSSSASVGAGDDPIRFGYYCFKFAMKPKSRLIPPLLILPDIFKTYFDQSFINYTKGRPSPAEWIVALDNYKAMLTPCTKKSLHWHHKNLSCCPWCEADKRQEAENNGTSVPGFKVKRFDSKVFK